jgi:hypothetical protein
MKQLNIVKYQIKELEIDVLIDYEKETVWLTTDQIAELFDVNKPAIVNHISNIYKDNELEISSTVSKMEAVGLEGDRYIIIDQNVLYHIGGSIKDLGKKITTLHLLDSGFINYILSNV